MAAIGKSTGINLPICPYPTEADLCVVEMMSLTECKKLLLASGIKIADEEVEKMLKYLTSLAHLEYELFNLKNLENDKEKCN